MEFSNQQNMPAAKLGGGGNIAVAVGKGTNSVQAFKWTLDTLIMSNSFACPLHLIHVFDPLRVIQTPLGSLPFEQANEVMKRHAKKQQSVKIEKLLQVYRKMCESKKVDLCVHCIESDSIPEAVVEQITKIGITKLILGSSSRRILKWLKKSNISAVLAENVPDSCAVMVIKHGRLLSVKDACYSFPCSSLDTLTITDTESDAPVSETIEGILVSEPESYTSRTTDLKLQFQDESVISESVFSSKDFCRFSVDFKTGSGENFRFERDFCSRTVSTGNSSYKSIVTSQTFEDLQFDCTDGDLNLSKYESTQFSSQISVDMITNNDSGIVNMQNSLKHNRKKSLSEAIDGSVRIGREVSSTESPASRLQVIEQFRVIEGPCAASNKILQQSKDESVQTLPGEMGRHEELSNAPSNVKVKINPLQRELVIMKQEAEKQRMTYHEMVGNLESLKNKLASEIQLRKRAERRAKLAEHVTATLLKKGFTEYSSQELKEATNDFSDDQRIGGGGCGNVYKGTIEHFDVAVKVLKKTEAQVEQQFQREVEILSHVRHPNIILLRGACKDNLSLVYEYMENGSLADHLMCRTDASVPLPWYVRIRICNEVATALIFLHNISPKGIVHLDIKPENILLDINFVSKLSDVGLARWLSDDLATRSKTGPSGTFAYMDPEYLRTGKFGLHSDVFALGVVILQVLTGKPPIGVVKMVETAMENHILQEVLDQSAGNWLLSEATELAKLGIHCTEPKQQDRPDLVVDVLPILNRINGVAQIAAMKEIAQTGGVVLPAFFCCPLCQLLMRNPHAAADGFTYEYACIKDWLLRHDISPMTNLKLFNKHLVKDDSLQSAIKRWEIDYCS